MTVERRPAEDRPPRMAALARLPVFLALDGKRAVVAGHSPAVAWKVELLSAAGANVDVFVQNPCEELRAVGKEPPRGAVTLHARPWTHEDFAGAAIAVGGCDEELVVINRRAALSAARQRRPLILPDDVAAARIDGVADKDCEAILAALLHAIDFQG